MPLIIDSQNRIFASTGSTAGTIQTQASEEACLLTHGLWHTIAGSAGRPHERGQLEIELDQS